MAAPRAFLWDSCVLYRWLDENGTEYVEHIEKFLQEAGAGQVDLYISTITLAEIRPSKMGKTGLTPLQVLDGVSQTFIQVSPSPYIMSLAGYLRDQSFRLVNVPEDQAFPRPLGLGDAIHLATAVALREEIGVQNLVLHSFDEGKTKDGNTGKKNVGILNFERWCRDCSGDEEIQRVISTPRKKPHHPTLPLPRIKSGGTAES
jgi:predicted nucleic acid-binding protein|tara:strand:+ start:101 stop:709 length:609 start_codon:yes stop_codon:yes gene_type:complete